MSLLSRFFLPRLSPSGARYAGQDATCFEVDVVPLGGTDGQAVCDFGPALAALNTPRTSIVAAELMFVGNESADGSPIMNVVKHQIARVLTNSAGNLVTVTGGNDGWIVPGAAYSGGFSWNVVATTKTAGLIYDPGADPTIFLGGRLRICLGPVTPILTA